MWPGLRPICKPSFILIHPTIWPQYTNVTDRTGQTDKQQSDSIGRTILQTVAQKLKEGWLPHMTFNLEMEQAIFNRPQDPHGQLGNDEI